jgi:Rrf2 family transcriptional regulator, cysteine metabolism repressor
MYGLLWINSIGFVNFVEVPEKVDTVVITVKPEANEEADVWVSRRTDYATRAILALALDGGGPLKLEELGRRTAVPQSVLEQVMPTMRTAGLVRSERGPAGGYRLNKRPEEITLERVVRLFQGQLAPIGCATRHNPEPCPMTVGCTLREVWEEVRDATISLLGGVTFADLAARAGGPWIDPSLLVLVPREAPAAG